MMKQEMTEIKKIARIAGMWYLADIVILVFSYMFVDAKLLVSGDTAASFANIIENMPLFYAGSAAFVIGYFCTSMAAIMLMKLLKPINSILAVLMPILLMIGVAVVLVGKTLEVYGVVTQNANLIAMRENIDMSAEILWGLWLLPLGLLIIKSELIAKIVGWLLLIACLSHLAAFGIYFFAPDKFASFETVIFAAGIGEFVLVGWLLVKGVRAEKGDN